MPIELFTFILSVLTKDSKESTQNFLFYPTKMYSLFQHLATIAILFFDKIVQNIHFFLYQRFPQCYNVIQKGEMYL